MEKEHKKALNDMAKERDLAKIELQQQNEEIDQLRQKLSENAEMISKQMSKISELEGRGGVPRGNRVSLSRFIANTVVIKELGRNRFHH
jgi:uncharacterized protein (DUF3084 family)